MLNPENDRNINLGVFGKEAEGILDFGQYLTLLATKGYYDLIKDQTELNLPFEDQKSRLIFLIGKSTMDVFSRRRRLNLKENPEKILTQTLYIIQEHSVDNEMRDILYTGVVFGLRTSEILPLEEIKEK